MAYKCKECNSTNVESKFWVNLNTFKIIADDDSDQNWCQDCEEMVEIYDDELEKNDNK